MVLDIREFQRYCKNGQTVFSMHFVDRCRQRMISISDTESAILSGEIIEEYPDDFPFPSCLILGTDSHQKPLHVVCALGEKQIYMISVYRPSPKKWEADLKTRKEEIPL